MTISDENTKVDHNIPISSSIDAVSDDVCKLAVSVDDKKKISADVPVCANCGKEGDEVNNICNKCKLVKYCNAACKKKHRHKHKKACEENLKLAAEYAAMAHDAELFKQPPSQYGDCPICFERMPSLITGSKYKSCCGKLICSGCDYAPVYDNQGNKVEKKCAFCRVPNPASNEEAVERLKKLLAQGVAIRNNNPIAIRNLGVYHRDGKYGYPQDYTKALELFHWAANLGNVKAYNNLGVAHHNGQGVEVDEIKAIHYYELAAMGGDVQSRHNLGVRERKAGNMDRALKHFMIAVRGGYDGSLNTIKQMYSKGYATKDDYTTALLSYQAYLVEIKNVQRDKAAAARKGNRYY